MTGSITPIRAGAIGGAIGARLLASGTPLAIFDPGPERPAVLSRLFDGRPHHPFHSSRGFGPA